MPKCNNLHNKMRLMYLSCKNSISFTCGSVGRDFGDHVLQQIILGALVSAIEAVGMAVYPGNENNGIRINRFKKLFSEHKDKTQKTWKNTNHV